MRRAAIKGDFGATVKGYNMSHGPNSVHRA